MKSKFKVSDKVMELFFALWYNITMLVAGFYPMVYHWDGKRYIGLFLCCFVLSVYIYHHFKGSYFVIPDN